MPAKAHLILDLTEKQQAAVEPLIAQVIEGNETGNQVMLVAQVYRDHILVGVASGKKMTLLREITESASARHLPIPVVTTR